MRLTIDQSIFGLVCILALGLVGCEMETRVVYSSWDTMHDLADPKPRDQRNLDPNHPHVRSPKGYAIQIASFEGGDSTQQAFELSNKLRSQAGLAELWYSNRGHSTIVYAGRYRDPRSDRARAALAQVRSAQIDGESRFAQAEIVPLSGGDIPVYNEYDLRNHRGGLTLQIGFYDSNFGPNFRKAAEIQAEILRGEGEDAYFYHGPNRSMVTIGLMTEDEAFVQNGPTQSYSPATRQLQEEYPYNMMNGVSFTVRENSETKIQESFLIRAR